MTKVTWIRGYGVSHVHSCVRHYCVTILCLPNVRFLKCGSGSSLVTINFVFERQTKNIELPAAFATSCIDFGNHAVQIQDNPFIPFNKDKHAGM